MATNNIINNRIASSAITNHGIALGKGTTTDLGTTALGGAGVILTGVLNSDPTWTTTTYPATTAIGDILVATAANTITAVTGAATAGWVLTANGALSSPTFQAPPAGGIVTLNGDAGSATGATVTLAGTANQIATSGAGATVTFSIPSSPSLAGTTTVATGLTATTGDITLTDGDVIITNKDVATTSPIAYFKKYRAAAALTSGDLTGTVKFGGYDGTQVTDSARITSTSSGTIASTRVAGDLKFYTHPDSAAADPTLRMTISPTGPITIATPDAGATALTLTNGAIVCNGANGLGDFSLGIFLPNTTTTTGRIVFGTVAASDTFIHNFGATDYTGNVFIGKEAGNYTLTAGNAKSNVGIGGRVLDALTDGTRNVALGYNSQSGITTGGCNCSIGVSSLTTASTSGYNMAIGYSSLLSATTGNGNNVAIGTIAGWLLTTGANNVLIGGCTNIPTITTGTGSAYTSSESNNILIHNAGVIGESNKIRIGTYGTGVGQQDTAYIAGVVHCSNGMTIDTGNAVVTSGNLTLPATSSTVGQIVQNGVTTFHDYGAASSTNIFVGKYSGNFSLTTASATLNTSCGTYCLTGLTTGKQNSSFGYSTLWSCTQGSYNVGFGGYTLPSLTTGSYNFAAGYALNGASPQGSGNQYSGAESSNLLIMNAGVGGDNNHIRIGTQGSGAGQQNATWIAGIYGVSVGATNGIVMIDNAGQLGSVASITVANGGTGAATLTDHGILLGSGTGAITPLGVATDGQIPIGSSGADPVLAAITASTGISVTNGAGTISIATSAGGMAVVDCTTSNAVAMAVNTRYIATSTNGTTLVVFTLPGTATIGDVLEVVGISTAYWEIDQNAANTIFYDNGGTTPGAAGKVTVNGAHQYASVKLVAITTANWVITSVTGAITLA